MTVVRADAKITGGASEASVAHTGLGLFIASTVLAGGADVLFAELTGVADVALTLETSTCHLANSDRSHTGTMTTAALTAVDRAVGSTGAM